MCARNFWAVNAAAFTPALEAFTVQTLGVAPSPRSVRIVSDLVRPSSAVFTLVRRLCDCDSLVGRGAAEARGGEVSAEHWLDWIHGMPKAVPHARLLAVLRAWAPEGDLLAPTTARCVPSGEVDEALLRGLDANGLLVIDLS